MRTTTIGEAFGRGGFERFGRGQYLQELPGTRQVKVQDFSGGYDSRDAREDVPKNTSPYAIDVEVSTRDEIIRAPGVVTRETFATRTPEQLVLHSSLDLTAELLVLDAPFLGISDGTTTTWTDHALPVGRYAWTNYGGRLLFSEGTTMYSRLPAAAPAAVAGAPGARAFATFAGRIIAGHVKNGASVVPMGLQWNAASAAYNDWGGVGAGFEELISNRLEVDYITNLVPLGFDLLVIVCRRSVWVASRTGQTDRPLDAQARIEGLGAVSYGGSCATPYGVAMLTDDGVQIFDGSSLQPIGDQIRNELLPLNLAVAESYKLHYHPSRDRLYVLTPTDTWVYEFARRRWYRRSLVALSAASFGATQNNYDIYFLGTDNLGRVVLGREDVTHAKYFDDAQTPICELPLEDGEYVNQIISSTQYLMKYLGEGTVDFWMPSTEGVYERVTGITLSPTTGTKPMLATTQKMHSGLALGIQLRIVSGTPRIAGVAADIILRGPRIPKPTARPKTLIAVKTAEGYWIFLPYDEVAGMSTGAFVESAGGLLLVDGAEGKVIRRVADGYITINDI